MLSNYNKLVHWQIWVELLCRPVVGSLSEANTQLLMYLLRPEMSHITNMDWQRNMSLGKVVMRHLWWMLTHATEADSLEGGTSEGTIWIWVPFPMLCLFSIVMFVYSCNWWYDRQSRPSYLILECTSEEPQDVHLSEQGMQWHTTLGEWCYLLWKYSDAPQTAGGL